MEPFATRRAKLQRNLHSDEAFLIRQSQSKVRNHDVHYPYHPSRDFFYLTGIKEPDMWLLITQTKTIVWSRPNTEKDILWEGTKLGDSVPQRFAIDEWRPTDNSQDLTNHLQQFKKIYTINCPNISHPNTEEEQGTNLIHAMRVIKDEHEMNAIRQACRISAAAHNHLMSITHRQQHETFLEGQFFQHITQHGIRSLAYPSIVAGGKNACTLHYTANNDSIKHSDLILVDAGCEYDEYCSDITRTFPCNGKFSNQQQALYEAVLDTQLQTIQKVKPSTSFKQLNAFAQTLLTEHLINLNILSGSVDQCLEEKSYLQYFPHGIGHTIGLDVHDIAHDKLEPGMVLTIEPGLYISNHEHYDNMGIRIEDNLLVTSNGHEVLTHNAVKSIDEIQHMMAVGA